MKIFLCGDVMTGRGIDQILPHPSKPHLFEPYVRDAREYITIAENRNGHIPRPVDYEYIWGDALSLLQKESVDARLINLETSITLSENYWPGKGINYRMNPENVNCISSAGIDCCVLSNNHVIDWGYNGLADTLSALDKKSITHAGAGLNRANAMEPVVVDFDEKGRLLIFAIGAEDSGIPPKWEATGNHAGVYFVSKFSEFQLQQITVNINKFRRKNDIVILSIHWGDNWGYDIPLIHREFAHSLIDNCGIDCVHGHSSHHAKGIEVYKKKLILYGCGDLINDYEGIYGYDEFRADLSLLYIVSFTDCGDLNSCKLIPMKLCRFRLNQADEKECKWFAEMFSGPAFVQGTKVAIADDNSLEVLWE
jgi:poly-gamma-glutamate capsule biosynthesis protein CapA/YwtB (metallophosphatase superfamily)